MRIWCMDLGRRNECDQGETVYSVDHESCFLVGDHGNTPIVIMTTENTPCELMEQCLQKWHPTAKYAILCSWCTSHESS